MDFLEQLKQQKQEGEQEWQSKRAEELRRQADEAARQRAELEQRQAAELERHRKKAEASLAALPAAIRDAAAKGLEVAVLTDSFIEEHPPEDKPSLPFVYNRRTYYLTDWLIPFHAMCQSNRVPLTVVTERVNVGIGGLRHRTFNVLAVDLKRL